MRVLTLGIALVALAITTNANAGTCNGEFGWLGKGNVYGMGEGSFVFTGEFSGAFFNTDTSDPTHKAATQCPGLWHVRADGSGNSNGNCIMRDAEGDKIFFEWSGTGTFPVTGGPFTFLGGTGKFNGVTGSGTFRGVTVASDDGGNGMGYATWTNCTYSLPN